jgi:hypothetical protein
MNEKLRECPFCGGERKDPESSGYYLEHNEDCYMREMSLVPRIQFIPFKKLQNWNTRHEPKHETVEEWENRTGKTYPDDGPVWIKSRYYKYHDDLTASHTDWFYEIIKYSELEYLQQHLLDDIEESEDPEVELICVANHHGKPEEV